MGQGKRGNVPTRAQQEHALAAVPQLRILRISDNMMKTLDGLRALPKLEKLSLVANRLSDLPELDNLAHMQELKEVYITGNAIIR